MRNDFISVAKGINKEFIFKGYRYRIETDVDKRGDVKAIRMDSDTLPPALRVSIKKDCDIVSRGLQRGGTLDALIEKFSLKPGESFYPLVIMDNGKAFSEVAGNIWGAATQVLKHEYRSEGTMTPSKPKAHRPQILSGGLK